MVRHQSCIAKAYCKPKPIAQAISLEKFRLTDQSIKTAKPFHHELSNFPLNSFPLIIGLPLTFLFHFNLAQWVLASVVAS